MSEILIATADPVFLESLRPEAESQGFALRTQDKIDQVVESVKNKPPQILIVDFDIHEQPPWDVLALLRQHPKTARLPILVVSGKHTTPRTMISSLSLGAVEYHVKPCDPRLLMARITALLTALQRPKSAPQEAQLRRPASARSALPARFPTSQKRPTASSKTSFLNASYPP